MSLDSVRSSLLQDFQAFLRSSLVGMIALYWRRLPVVASTTVILGIAAFAVFGPLVQRWSPDAIDWDVLGKAAASGPDLASGHYFGTDDLGRDLFARLVVALRRSLLVGGAALYLALMFGAAYGVIAGFAGPRLRSLLIWAAGLLETVPPVLLICLLSWATAGSLFPLIVTLGLTSSLPVIRVVSARTQELAKAPFIEAARIGGARERDVVLYHLMPNLVGQIALQLTLLFPEIVLLDALVTFFVSDPRREVVSLGLMMADGARALGAGNIWPLVVPAALLGLLQGALYLRADLLRDTAEGARRGA